MRPVPARASGALALVAALAGCDGWNDLEGPLWTPEAPTVVDGHLYVTLDRAGDVARLSPDGEVRILSAGDDTEISRLVPSPDGTVLLAVTTSWRCDDPDAGGLVYVDECGEPVARRHVRVLHPEGDDTARPLGPAYGTFAFSPDGRFVVAVQDGDVVGVGDDGIADLGAVWVFDRRDGVVSELPVGFDAHRVLFTGGDETTGMLVLSRRRVALVDLTEAVPVVEATFPLTLDADAEVRPRDVVLTPDGTHALISVTGSSDLYVLDLVNPSINIVSLAGEPSRMVVDAARDRTLLTYARRGVLEILSHDLWEIRDVALDEGAGELWLGDGFALAWDPDGRDVHRIDLETLRVTEYRLNWAPHAFHVAPDASFAVALSAPGGAGRLEILDLRVHDGRYHTDPRPFALAGPGLDVAFTTEEAETTVLLLQQGQDALYALRWPSLARSEVALPSAPVAIGALDGDTFYVTHPDPLGLVSFYEPGEELRSVGGFGAVGLLDRTKLVVDDEEAR